MRKPAPNPASNSVKRLKKLNKSQKGGFSLIELMVVMAITVTLAGGMIYANRNAKANAQSANTAANIAAVATAKASYMNDPGTTVTMQTTFDNAGTSNATRLAAIAPFLTVSGSNVSTSTQIAANTSGTDCIIGNSTTAPVIQ